MTTSEEQEHVEAARKATHVIIDTVSAYEHSPDEDVSLWLALLPATNFELNEAASVRLVVDGTTVDPSARLGVDASRLLLAMSLMTNLLLIHTQQGEHLQRVLLHDLRGWVDRYFSSAAR